MPKSVLIFGATEGIGKIIATHFVFKESLVTLSARNCSGLEELKENFSRAGFAANTAVADISKEAMVIQAFESHYNKFGAPDVVINSAAIQGPIGPIWTNSADEWQATLNIDLFGSFLVAKYAIQFMAPQQYGSIILFSGGGAAYARPNFSAYGAAKTGVLRLVETVADELKNGGYSKIIINAIAPGAVKTNMTKEILNSKTAGVKETSEAKNISKTGGTPPEQLTDLVDFLADLGTNNCLTGRLIHVREDYRGFVNLNADHPLEENGKLRRLPLL